MESGGWRGGGDKAPRRSHGVGSITASFTCEARSARAPRITMSASDKSHIPARQQQIVIGIPFMSHHMPSYPLQENRNGGLSNRLEWVARVS